MLIPKDFDKNIEALTRNIARNKSSRYEQVTSLRDYFTSGNFTYSTDVDYTSSQKSMAEFLDKKVGFCEQFAATYAAMARAIRIPSRVVIGFSPGSANANGEFVVNAKQAHSWVEVYLTGIGWLTIDPTPAGNLPGQAPSNIGEAVATTTTTSTTTAATSPTTTNASQASSSTIIKSEVAPVKSDKDKSTIFSLSNILILILALIISAAIFAYLTLRKKKKAKISKISIIHDSYKKILRRFIDNPDANDMTMAEAKMKIPADFPIAQKFIDKYSDYSYSYDSDINLEELSETAEKALEEIATYKKEKTSV